MKQLWQHSSGWNWTYVPNSVVPIALPRFLSRSFILLGFWGSRENPSPLQLLIVENTSLPMRLWPLIINFYKQCRIEEALKTHRLGAISYVCARKSLLQRQSHAPVVSARYALQSQVAREKSYLFVFFFFGKKMWKIIVINNCGVVAGTRGWRKCGMSLPPIGLGTEPVSCLG